MKLKRLGRSEIMVSELCLGSMTWGSQNSESEAHEQLDYAIGEGVNFIDSAEMYPTTPRLAETSGLSEEQQKKMEFMRAFLRKAEGGFTDQEQGDVQKDFRGLMNPCDTSAKNPGIGEQSQGNKQPDSREASLRGTPVVQSDGYTKQGETPALRNEDSTPPVTVIRFPRSGASGKSVASDALAQAKRWIGQFVLVTPMKGVQQHGVLIEISGNGLRLEKNMVAGTISLPFKDNEIESIQLLK